MKQAIEKMAQVVIGTAVNKGVPIAKEGLRLANTNLGSAIAGAATGSFGGYLLTRSYREKEIQDLRDELSEQKNLTNTAKDGLNQCASSTQALNIEFLKTLVSLGDSREKLSTCERKCADAQLRFDTSFCLWRNTRKEVNDSSSPGLENS